MGERGAINFMSVLIVYCIVLYCTILYWCVGANEKFSKPWAQTLMMFSGEVLCLLQYYIMKHINDKKTKQLDETTSLLSKNDQTSTISVIHTPFYIFIAPTFLDLLGTTLGGIYVYIGFNE